MPNERGSQLSFIKTAVRPLALAIISCCLLPTAIRAADSPSNITAAVDRAFRPLLEEHDVPGIAVAVTVDGQQYFFNYGCLERQEYAVTKDTRFSRSALSARHSPRRWCPMH
jgi:beta-lactamase class C